LNGQQNSISEVFIYTLTGQEVYTTGKLESKTKELNIDLDQLPNGLYLMKTMTKRGMITKKIEIFK